MLYFTDANKIKGSKGNLVTNIWNVTKTYRGDLNRDL